VLSFCPWWTAALRSLVALAAGLVETWLDVQRPPFARGRGAFAADRQKQMGEGKSNHALKPAWILVFRDK
jgi:hypothetical protein